MNSWFVRALKVLGIAFACLFAAFIGFIVYMMVTAEPYRISGSSEDGCISYFVDDAHDDMLYVNITDPGLMEWRYETGDSTERLVSEKSDFDGFHFGIAPGQGDGTGTAVVGEYEEDGTEALSYGVVTFTFKSGRIVSVDSVLHTDTGGGVLR